MSGQKFDNFKGSLLMVKNVRFLFKLAYAFWPEWSEIILSVKSFKKLFVKMCHKVLTIAKAMSLLGF